jgi:hypothetical protein
VAVVAQLVAVKEAAVAVRECIKSARFISLREHTQSQSAQVVVLVNLLDSVDGLE